MDNSQELVSGSSRPSVFAQVYHSDLETLQNRLFILADLALTENKQRKAFKESVIRLVWADWAEHLDGRDPRSAQSLPRLKED